MPVSRQIEPIDTIQSVRYDHLVTSTHDGASARSSTVLDSDDRRYALLTFVLPFVILILAGIAMMAIGAVVDGVEDGGVEMGFVPFAAFGLGMYAVVIFVIVAATRQFPTDRPWCAHWTLAIASAAGVVTVITATFGESASAWPMLAFALPIGAIAGLTTYVFVRRALPKPAPPETNAPAPATAIRRGTAVDRTAIWSGRVPPRSRSRWSTVVTIAISGVLLAIMLVTSGGPWTGAFLSAFPVPLVLVTTAFYRPAAERVRVTVGPSGLILRNGITTRVVYSAGLDHIESAWFTDAPKVSAWTSYGKQSTSSRLSFLSREGPALLVRLTDGTDIVVTLDQPDQAAGVINDLLDRRASVPPSKVVGR